MKVGDKLRNGTHEIVTIDGEWGIMESKGRFHIFHFCKDGWAGVWVHYAGVRGLDRRSDCKTKGHTISSLQNRLVSLNKLLNL